MTTTPDNLTPDPANANRGTVRGLGMVERSLQQYGAGRSILATSDGVVIAGNKTLDRARELGIPVQEIESDGKTLFVVKRTDLTYDDPRAKELAIADNRSSETGLDWDPDVLASLADDGVDLSQFWFEDELGDLLATDDTTEGLTDQDDVPDVPDEPITKPGDLWILGRHRLGCIDATDGREVARLLDGALPYILTDPPYSSGGYGAHQRARGTFGAIANDNLSEEGYLALIERALGAVSRATCCFVFTDWRMWHRTLQAAEVKGFKARNMIVWDKETPGLGSPWRTQHELIYYGRRDSGPTHGGKYGNVLKAQRSGNHFHDTEKPVSLIEQILENTEGDAVYDPFAGSGTTLIGCESIGGRTAYLAEIDPARCDVIVKRWQDFTGETATRAEYAEAAD